MQIQRQHARLMRLATAAALAVALSLVLAKAIAWWLSGSVSLLAGLTDSLLDSAASLINLVAVHFALQPADEFGHRLQVAALEMNRRAHPPQGRGVSTD